MYFILTVYSNIYNDIINELKQKCYKRNIVLLLIVLVLPA